MRSTLRFFVATFVLAVPLPVVAQTPADSPSPKPAASPSPASPTPATAELAPSHATSTASGPLGEDFHGGSAEATVQGLDVDTVSSKFLEYRDIPQGLSIPDFHAAGEKSRLGAFRYRVPNPRPQRRSNSVVPSESRVFREPRGRA